MMTLKTKVAIHATAKDIEPLQNFLAWLVEMDYDVANACSEIITSAAAGISINTIYAILDILLENIEIDD